MDNAHGSVKVAPSEKRQTGRERSWENISKNRRSGQLPADVAHRLCAQPPLHPHIWVSQGSSIYGLASDLASTNIVAPNYVSMGRRPTAQVSTVHVLLSHEHRH